MSRAANNAFAGHMRPAGSEFETPGLKYGLVRGKTLSTLKYVRRNMVLEVALMGGRLNTTLRAV